MAMKSIILSQILIAFLAVTLFSCGSDDLGVQPPPSKKRGLAITILYSITGSGQADIEYTDENGVEVDLNNEQLPWEISFEPSFDEGILNMNAACGCKMTALILINGNEVDTEDGFVIIMAGKWR